MIRRFCLIVSILVIIALAIAAYAIRFSDPSLTETQLFIKTAPEIGGIVLAGIVAFVCYDSEMSEYD